MSQRRPLIERVSNGRPLTTPNCSQLLCKINDGQKYRQTVANDVIYPRW